MTNDHHRRRRLPNKTLPFNTRARVDAFFDDEQRSRTLAELNVLLQAELDQANEAIAQAVSVAERGGTTER